MNGREKIEAALSVDGTDQIAAVIPYDSILFRDHWDELTSSPWWYAMSPDIEHQMSWRKDVIKSSGTDWFMLPSFFSCEDRENARIEERSDGVFRVDIRTGKRDRLEKPPVSGWSHSGELESMHPEQWVSTTDEIDALIPDPPVFDPDEIRASGCGDLAFRMLSELGDRYFPIWQVNSPLWCCYHLWGFEGMMEMIVSKPDLVHHACNRYLRWSIRGVHEAALMGAAGVWIEECLTDVISPASFDSLSVPYVSELIDEMNSLGLKSIYYFCGDPSGKWDSILSTGTDSLALEEGKKGFRIDIVETAERVRGQCALFGNIDAIGVLQDGDDSMLRTEIDRQKEAARLNSGRFIMSLGSPVTPSTPIERVRLYCDLVREMGQIDR